MENLSRFRPDLCRDFSTILGSTFEPGVPLSPTPGITVAQGLAEPCALKHGSGDSGGGGSSIDGNKFHQSRAPTHGLSKFRLSDPFNRHRG